MALSTKQEQKTKKNIVWTTERVDSWMKDYSEGMLHKETPWSDGVIGVRNPDIVFEYTPKEIEELTKCAHDIIYFANKYCYCLQGSKGYRPITLRDYQEEMLNAYYNNRFNITLSCRQIGKCLFGGKIELHQTNKNFHKYIEDIYYKQSKSFLSKIKYLLLKIYRKL